MDVSEYLNSEVLMSPLPLRKFDTISTQSHAESLKTVEATFSCQHPELMKTSNTGKTPKHSPFHTGETGRFIYDSLSTRAVAET